MGHAANSSSTDFDSCFSLAPIVIWVHVVIFPSAVSNVDIGDYKQTTQNNQHKSVET